MRVVSILLAALFIVTTSVLPTGSAEDNSVLNGGFEAALTSWTPLLEGCSTLGASSAWVDAGSFSLRLARTNSVTPLECGVTQDLLVQPGTLVSASARANVVTLATGGPSLQLHWLNLVGGVIGSSHRAADEVGTQTIALGALAPPQTVKVRVRLVLDTQEASDGYFDTIRVNTVTNPLPPAAPSGLAASLTGSGRVRIDWEPADGNWVPVLGYLVLRGGASGSETPLRAVAGSTQFIDNEAPVGQMSYYVVRGYSVAGIGGASNEVVAVPSPVGAGEWTPVTISNPNFDLGVNVSWNKVRGAPSCVVSDSSFPTGGQSARVRVTSGIGVVMACAIEQLVQPAGTSGILRLRADESLNTWVPGDTGEVFVHLENRELPSQILRICRFYPLPDLFGGSTISAETKCAYSGGNVNAIVGAGNSGASEGDFQVTHFQLDAFPS